MITARSFVAWLLVTLVTSTGLALTFSPAGGAGLAVFLVIGLVCLLPHAAPRTAGEWRVILVPPARTADVWWAEDWDEPLVPYRFTERRERDRPAPAAGSRRSDRPGQVRADRGA